MKTILLSFVFFMFNTFLLANVMLDGYAYLNNQTNHDSVMVYLEMEAPQDSTYTIFTDSSGYYQQNIASGFYNIVYSKDGYHTQYIYDANITSNTTMADITLSWHLTFINIPDDFSSIQNAIDYSYDTDTLLVQPGTYYEHINFKGKAITLASLILTTGDTTYISQTIIDGSNNGRVITFNYGENSNTILNGFTIQNGKVTENNASGGGISCDNSSPTLKNLRVINNTAEGSWDSGLGGGLYSINSEALMQNIVFEENSSNYKGGAIFCEFSGLELIDVIIKNNYADYGGGIFNYGANVPSMNLENVAIKNNYAVELGGGIYFTAYSSADFSSSNRSNIFSNTAGNSIGADIYADDCPIIDVVVDTFTVLNPTSYFASPLDNFTFDILNAAEPLIDADIYVSVDGDNDNSGTSPEEPFQTINYALGRIFADETDPNTIHLAAGVYKSSTNGESFPITWGSHVNLSGSLDGESIVNASGSSRVIIFDNVEQISIENITVKNGYWYWGAGIYCESSSPNFKNIVITGNSASDFGAGIVLNNSSDAIFENVTITDNSADNEGSALRCSNSDPILKNSIIANNTGDNTVYISSGSPSIEYSNFYNNTGSNFAGNVNPWLGVNATVNTNGDSCDVFYNIKMNPLFEDPDNGNYNLTWFNFPIADSTKSPCIDAGDPNSSYDPDNTVRDMGVYYFDQNQLVANFLVDSTEGYQPFTVNFTDHSTNSDSITTWEWDFDYNGTIDSYEQNPSYTYADTGNYSVSLTIEYINDSIKTKVKTNYITVRHIRAEFTADTTVGYSPLEVEFTDESEGPISAWEWDFDNDGMIDSYEQNPTYTFNDTGSYSVSLTVIDSNDYNDTEVKEDYINVIGKVNYSLGFNGSDSYVGLSEPLSIFSTSFTVGMWAYFNDDSRGILIGDYNISEGINVNFEKSAEKRLRLYWNGSPNIYTPENVFELNEWQYLTFVRNKDTEEVEFYVNGDLVHTYDETLSDKTATIPHRIGRDSRSGSTALNGFLDEINIWNQPLSQIEIQNAMNNGLNGNESGLVNYWKFDHGYGDITYDSTSTENNGTIHSAYWSSNIPSYILSANYDVDKNLGYLPLTVSFSDYSTPTDSIITWEWDFDNDGTFDSYEQNPSYTYFDTGSYPFHSPLPM